VSCGIDSLMMRSAMSMPDLSVTDGQTDRRTDATYHFPQPRPTVKWVKLILPYPLPSVGPGADPGVHAVSPQVTLSHPSGGRLPLLFARPAVTFPAEERHRP